MDSKAQHSEKWHSCWEKVQEQGYDESEAAAICTAALGDESYDAAATVENTSSVDDPVVLVDAIDLALRMALAPVVARLRAVETATDHLTPVPARVAALEALAPVPGPPGPAGAHGLGFDDAGVEYDGERTITITWARGDARAERPIKIPAMLYRGVYVPGKLYERGDVVTLGGSLWHANADTTTRPGDGAPAWTLAVKRGRDGSR